MTKETKHPYRPDYAVPPGATLAEALDDRGMTQAELTQRTGLEPQYVAGVMAGTAAITQKAAEAFEAVLGIPVTLWLSLERGYRERLSELKARPRILSGS